MTTLDQKVSKLEHINAKIYKETIEYLKTLPEIDFKDKVDYDLLAESLICLISMKCAFTPNSEHIEKEIIDFIKQTRSEIFKISNSINKEMI